MSKAKMDLFPDNRKVAEPLRLSPAERKKFIRGIKILIGKGFTCKELIKKTGRPMLVREAVRELKDKKSAERLTVWEVASFANVPEKWVLNFTKKRNLGQRVGNRRFFTWEEADFIIEFYNPPADWKPLKVVAAECEATFGTAFQWFFQNENRKVYLKWGMRDGVRSWFISPDGVEAFRKRKIKTKNHRFPPEAVSLFLQGKTAKELAEMFEVPLSTMRMGLRRTVEVNHDSQIQIQTARPVDPDRTDTAA